MTGATGFIGRALVPALLRDGHTVVAWVRSASRARARLGAEVEVAEATGGPTALTAILSRSDAVINLAGEPILGRRWTAARRQVLHESRVGETKALVRALHAANPRPSLLVSGSAVGYYGDRGEERLTEQSEPGNDFLAQLCRDWEQAAVEAEPLGVRVVRLRTGVVLGRDGGALAQMLPPFRMGAGGPIGSGRQYVPWIHLHDLVGIISAAIADSRYRGPVNGVAPEPATSRDFARALGAALHRPAVLPVPGVALRLLFGDAAVVLLGGQRAEPTVATALGFRYAFPTLAGALADIVGGTDVRISPLSALPDTTGDDPGRGYLARHKPSYLLRTTTIVNAPLDQVFPFFSRAENLGLITPAGMGFAIRGAAPTIAEDTTIDYTVRIGFSALAWRSRIVRWQPGRAFVDQQERGPYASWWHEHVFRAEGNRTVMDDRVYYAPPLGLLGRLANRVFIAPTLRRVFQYRGDVIRLRFGTS
ncbi:MAG: TIGR01777 family oxidoreductase [Acidobacteriota bacterium]